MPLFVPDASVILKWVLPPDNEGFVEQALDIRRSLLAGFATLAVPNL